MSRYDYDEYEKLESSGKFRSGAGRPSYKGYFHLDDDLDSAIVRFAYSSPKEFDIVSYHRVKSGDRNIKVSCLRSPVDEIDLCPLCAAEEKLSTKFFVKVIEYNKDEDGKIVAEGKIWETRPAFRKKLKTLADEYGTLSDIIFKIVRHGAKGSTSTDYDIIPASPKIYKDELYPYDENIFKDYQVVGRGGAVRVKTYEDMVAFLETGDFPAPKQAETAERHQSRNLEQLEISKEEEEALLGKEEDTPTLDEKAEEERPSTSVRRTPTRTPVKTDTTETETYTRPRRYTL